MLSLKYCVDLVRIVAIGGHGYKGAVRIGYEAYFSGVR